MLAIPPLLKTCSAVPLAAFRYLFHALLIPAECRVSAEEENKERKQQGGPRPSSQAEDDGT